ncbi:uncharacterized protein LOC131939125 [Physella acuta]|uniref:uncharacterized protein LOC131939125 n=1 Tax=Physella acuta TaxID=109671 RepID=UPI0027DD38DC|nr:uncharacterized protein LOC131939125 [Physella acuta]
MAAKKNNIEELIQMIQCYPMLYDASHPDFKKKKDPIYEEIGNILGESGEDVKRKWRNLKDTFTRSIRGQSFYKNGQTKWKWTDQMEFMRPHFNMCSSTGANDSVNSVSCDDMIKTEPFEISCESDIPASPELPTATEIYPTSSTREKTNFTQPHVPKKRRRVSFDSDASVTSEEIKTDLDRVDYFFLGYAEFFKKLSPSGQIRIKLKMAQMFTEEELKELND